MTEVEKLREVLRKYRHCRHGQVECFCTKEAAEALAESDKEAEIVRLKTALDAIDSIQAEYIQALADRKHGDVAANAAMMKLRAVLADYGKQS